MAHTQQDRDHDADYLTTQFSEIHHAYNNPYYQPLTSAEKTLAVQSYEEQARREAHYIHRTNIFRVFAIGGGLYFFTYPLFRAAQMQWVRPDVRFIAPEINYRWSAIKFTLQKEGPHHMWRGVLPGMAYWGGSVWAQQFCEDFLSRPDLSQKPEEFGNVYDLIQGAVYATGMSTVQLALHPLRIAQTKLATDLRIKGLSAWYKYATSFDCLLRVVRFNGIAGLFSGGSLIFLRNYIFWLAQFIHVNRIILRDETGYVPIMNWERQFYAWRYEIRLTQIYAVLMPLEALISRRLYRIPTFKTDRMPSHFPKIWAPTFTGLFNFYRGSIAWTLTSFLSIWLSFRLSERAKEELLPANERPSYKDMLFYARYAQFQRRQDELKGNIIEFPTYHPTYGHNSQIYHDYYETSQPLHRFALSDAPPMQSNFHPGDIDIDSIRRGNYDHGRANI